LPSLKLICRWSLPTQFGSAGVIDVQHYGHFVAAAVIIFNASISVKNQFTPAGTIRSLLDRPFCNFGHILDGALAHNFKRFLLRFCCHFCELSHISERLFKSLFGNISTYRRALFVMSHCNGLSHSFLQYLRLPADKSLPTLKRDHVRICKSFNILSFSIYNRGKINSWKLVLT
jgi:hypothetical protein